MCTNPGEQYISMACRLYTAATLSLSVQSTLHSHKLYKSLKKRTIGNYPKSQLKMSAALVKSLNFPQGPNIDFGAEISGVDVENLTGKKRAIEAI